jgi:hypothetical protein
VKLYDLTVIKNTHSATGICMDCYEEWIGIDSRLPTLQHAKQTGHKVTVMSAWVERFEAKEAR